MNVAEEIPYAEAMACVKVLVALLKADGAIDPNE